MERYGCLPGAEEAESAERLAFGAGLAEEVSGEPRRHRGNAEPLRRRLPVTGGRRSLSLRTSAASKARAPDGTFTMPAMLPAGNAKRELGMSSAATGPRYMVRPSGRRSGRP